MGAVEDIRKALQDVVTPDLKALQVEVREGFVTVERVAAIRHELVLAELRPAQAIAESRHEAILRALDIEAPGTDRSAAGDPAGLRLSSLSGF